MKSDRTTVKRRVETVLHMRLAGAEFADIREYAAEDHPETGRPWNVSDSQLWRYIKAGDKLLALTLDKDRERNLNRHLAARRALLGRCLAAGDFSNARQLLADEAKLLDLYPADRHELTGKAGGPLMTANVELTPDERAAALTALLGRLAALGPADRRPNSDGPGDGPGSTVGETRTPDGAGGPEAGPLAGSIAPLDF